MDLLWLEVSAGASDLITQPSAPTHHTEEGRTIILPKDIDPDYFDNHFRTSPILWKKAVQHLCITNNIPFEPFEPFRDGSNLIASVSKRHVIKIFPPFHRHQWESDSRVLSHLDGKLSVPTPAYESSGEIEHGWTFLIMSKLPGRTLETFWPAMSLPEKQRVLEHIGRLIKEVQALPVEKLDSLRPLWNDFLANQFASYKSRHKRMGMPGWFMDQVDDFVKNSLHLLQKPFQPTLLTGEYTPFNLLAVEEEGSVKLSGMLDFGDAMVGYALYDLLGPSLFLAEGKGNLVASLLRGYGLSWSMDSDVRRQLMLLQILHRYSNFNFQARIPDWDKKAKSIEDLENIIWPHR